MALLPQPHDPTPDRLWRPWRKTDRGWWCDPSLPLPVRAAVVAAAPRARNQDKPVYPASDEPAALWALLSALLDCSANFHGPRRGLAGWEATENPERIRLALELGRLLPPLRQNRCVRPVASAPGPRYLAAALARLRVLVAICDPTDADADAYWVNRVKSVADLASCAGAMGKQVDGRWERREKDWEVGYGG